VTGLLTAARAMLAGLLALALAAPGLSSCWCDLFSAGPERCCDDQRVASELGAAQLDDGPCCCCALDVDAVAASASTATPREAQPGPAPASGPNVGLVAAAPLVGARGSLRLRPPPGPDPSPPPGLIVHRTTVLLI